MNEKHFLGRFQIDQLLSSTTAADIYRATDTVLNRTLLLRVFKDDFVEDKQTTRRIVTALQNSSELVHPHIAWVWDLGEEEGKVFSTERYVEGEALDEYLSTGLRRMVWDEVLTAINQAASALSFSHNRGVFHGNLSPENFIISPEHGAILYGFGLPQMVAIQEASVKGDQGALAWLLVIMVTGQLENYMAEDLPQEWPLGFPPLVEEALRRATGKQAPGPYQSVEEFITAVKWLASQPQPSPTSEQLNRMLADQEAIQKAEIARQQAAEDIVRQAGLEVVRQEINERLQRAVEEQTRFEEEAIRPLFEGETVDSQAVQPDEIETSAGHPEEQAAIPGAQADKPIQSEAAITSVPSLTGVNEPGPLDDEKVKISKKPSRGKTRRRRAWFIVLLVVLIISSILAWLYFSGGLESFFPL